jgi:glycerol-3-phosphate dehydrogenase
LTRDYSFEIDSSNDAAPVLTVFGGKLTTHRKLAEHAMKKLQGLMKWPTKGRTRTEILPGGDFGSGGAAGYEKEVEKRFSWLPVALVARYVRQYGTRVDDLLSGVRTEGDLGKCFGADLYQREVDFLVETEWAETAEDIVWRRTKTGLCLNKGEIDLLRTYLRQRHRSAVFS